MITRDAVLPTVQFSGPESWQLLDSAGPFSTGLHAGVTVLFRYGHSEGCTPDPRFTCPCRPLRAATRVSLDGVVVWHFGQPVNLFPGDELSLHVGLVETR